MGILDKKTAAWFRTASHCKYSGLPVSDPEIFESRHPGSNYAVEFAKLGKHILLVKGSGYVSAPEMTEAMQFLDDYVSKNYHTGKHIFLIEDYADIQGAEPEARKRYIKHHKESAFLFGGALYNLPVLFRISFNLAKRMHIKNEPLYAVRSYPQAIDLATKITCQNSSLPDSDPGVTTNDRKKKQFGTSPQMNRSTENKPLGLIPRMINQFIGLLSRGYSEALLTYIGSIDWREDGCETPDTRPFPDKSAKRVFEAIGFIKSEVDDLLREREDMYKNLKESEIKYRSLVEYSADHIFMLDLDGFYIASNDNVATFGFQNGADLVGKSLKDVYAADLLDFYQSQIKKLLETAVPTHFHHEIKTSGDPVYLLDTLYPVYRNNKLWAIGGICRDITEEKRLETEAQKLQEKIQQSQKMESIGTLAGGIAHDFNNILSAILGYAELSLDDVEKNSHVEENLKEIYTAGKRAKDLTHQILLFARQSNEETQPIQVSTTVREVLQFLRATLPTTITIKHNIESDSLIIGNQTEVHQIMMNLCTNAAHAMGNNGGFLEIALTDMAVNETDTDLWPGLKPGDYIMLKVADTGTGIPPDIIQSIFDPYFTTKEVGKGTGMGLSMVKGIVESYGGRIYVASRINEGTTFKILLPVTKKRKPERFYETEVPPTGTEHILFIDDEMPIAKMGGQLLEHLGYSVTTRTSSVEALELFKKKTDDFDLVITDMTMPNMTGEHLAAELIKIRKDIPIILCTGYSDGISDESALKIGIKALLYKPIVKADLAKTIRKILDTKSGGRSTQRVNNLANMSPVQGS